MMECFRPWCGDVKDTIGLRAARSDGSQTRKSRSHKG